MAKTKLSEKKSPEKKPAKRQFKTDQEMLDYIKTTIMDQIQDNLINLKVGDLLKIFEIQKKLSSDTKTEEKLWEIIEQIRPEALKHE
ncbi:MAG: hypothetical protein PHR28_02640 [candidate division Zixibacteria bacterium]|nr:hypothetical protein [candidate division Zixibacteria bacterium]